MMTVLFIAALLVLAYAVLMLLYRKGWNEQPVFTLPVGFVPGTKISIIIPARNEELNIGKCLDAVIQQDYPAGLFEVIVVDDHSADNTATVVSNYNNPAVRCIKLADYPSDANTAYKKKALSLGISISTGELIVTTDADCFMGTNWLKFIAGIYEREKPVMIVAPVDFTSNGSLVQLFQSLDFMSMQGITAASHNLGMGNMSNGANLAFTRKAYDSVDGYTGIDHLASGDDYLLMMKLKAAYPVQISYLKSQQAIVHTLPQPTWGSFLQQRIRWASKSGKYDDKRLTTVLSFVYVFNFSFLVLGIAGLFAHDYWLILLGMLFVKTEMELYYLYPVSGFFNKRHQLILFPLLQPLHIMYIILAGFLGLIGVYKWKGRTVK